MTHDPPAEELPFSVSRREFLPALVREALVTIDLARGGQGARLSELGELPDEQLALVRPILNPACEILVEEDWVCAKHRGAGTPIKLFSLDQEANLAVFNLFGGQLSLGDIGQQLAQEMGWEPARGFDHARGLFLSLASRRVCLPKDPPGPRP
jgi:hypothetical protein